MKTCQFVIQVFIKSLRAFEVGHFAVKMKSGISRRVFNENFISDILLSILLSPTVHIDHIRIQ